MYTVVYTDYRCLRAITSLDLSVFIAAVSVKVRCSSRFSLRILFTINCELQFESKSPIAFLLILSLSMSSLSTMSKTFAIKILVSDRLVAGDGHVTPYSESLHLF